jgi:hypothetical protein
VEVAALVIPAPWAGTTWSARSVESRSTRSIRPAVAGAGTVVA